MQNSPELSEKNNQILTLFKIELVLHIINIVWHVFYLIYETSTWFRGIAPVFYYYSISAILVTIFSLIYLIWYFFQSKEIKTYYLLDLKIRCGFLIFVCVIFSLVYSNITSLWMIIVASPFLVICCLMWRIINLLKNSKS